MTTSKKRRRKDEIIANCIRCGSERVMAYWDAELASYLYLCDEPPICLSCAAKTAPPMLRVISQK